MISDIDVVRIQERDFSLQEEYDRLRSVLSGAVVTFTGLVREFNAEVDSSPIEALYLQHYPGMTERLIEETIAEARERWPVNGVTVIHRVGELMPGDQIVLVAVSAMHREAAFQSATFLMDYLKTRTTFWKKTRSGGKEQWLDMKTSDRKAADRWRSQSQQQQQQQGNNQ